MSSVSTYLNFMGNAAEAFDFYAAAFGTEIRFVMRNGDAPAMPGGPELSDDDKNKVMHIALPILGGHMLLATDMLASMGHELKIGNNTTINLEPDTREETDALYAALSEGGSDGTGMMDMFWGAYWGCVLDRFGIRWMFNCYVPAPVTD